MGSFKKSYVLISVLSFFLSSDPTPDSCMCKEEGLGGLIPTGSPAGCRVGLQVWAGFHCWRLVMDECSFFTFIIPLIFFSHFPPYDIKGQSLPWSFQASFLSVPLRWDESKGTCLWSGPFLLAADRLFKRRVNEKVRLKVMCFVHLNCLGHRFTRRHLSENP